jgi:hypothetical protein
MQKYGKECKRRSKNTGRNTRGGAKIREGMKEGEQEYLLEEAF